MFVNCGTAVVLDGDVPETNFDFFYLNLCSRIKYSSLFIAYLYLLISCNFPEFYFFLAASENCHDLLSPVLKRQGRKEHRPIFVIPMC